VISGRILAESTGSCRNLPEKIREILDRNTASNFLVFSVASRPFPAVRRSPGLSLFFCIVHSWWYVSICISCLFLNISIHRTT
jgi:hypothetical protein